VNQIEEIKDIEQDSVKPVECFTTAFLPQ